MKGHVSLHRDIRRQRAVVARHGGELRQRLRRIHYRLQTPTVVLPAFLCGVILVRLLSRLPPARDLVAAVGRMTGEFRELNDVLRQLILLLQWAETSRETVRQLETAEVPDDRQDG